MNYILAIVCACITGIAIGIGMNHKLADNPAPIVQSSMPSTQLVASDGTAISTTALDAADIPDVHFDSIAVSQMQEQLQQLLAQQEEMRNHQSELNRELNAIQFRLDTHSESFRPLRSERDTETITPPTGLSPLLPPLR